MYTQVSTICQRRNSLGHNGDSWTNIDSNSNAQRKCISARVHIKRGINANRACKGAMLHRHRILEKRALILHDWAIAN